jgi:hypothetical protein
LKEFCQKFEKTPRVENISFIDAFANISSSQACIIFKVVLYQDKDNL